MKDNIESIFLIIAFIYLVAGMGLGIGMGIAEDFAYAHLHAHINLVGFVAHGLFGITHRLWPALRDSFLSTPQVLLAVCGAPVFLIGLPLAQFHGQPALAIIGSLLLLASAILFLVMFATKSMRSTSPV